MTLSADDVRQVAVLARLGLSDEEVVTYSHQLAGVIGYVEKIAELDLEGVEPTAHAVPLTNVIRVDEVRPSLDREDALANAPEREGDSFLVPKII